jgi:hypothetical protein
VSTENFGKPELNFYISLLFWSEAKKFSGVANLPALGFETSEPCDIASGESV